MNSKTEAIVEDIKRVALKLKKKSLSRSEYFQYGKFNSYQIYDGGKSWTSLCQQAGIKTKTKELVSDEEYFQRLSKAVELLDRYPKASERKKYGLNVSKRRFPTLPSLIKAAIKLGYVPDLYKSKSRKRCATKGIENQPSIVELIKSALSKRGREKRPVPPIPLDTRRTKWERTGLSGFPYAPQEEQGVLALFSILCSDRILPWQILDLSGGKGIDATCYDEIENKEIKVELKHILSKGSWNHPIDELDYVVCWENRWPDFPKPVIELSKLI